MNDQVVVHPKTAQAGPPIGAGTAQIGMLSQQPEMFGDILHHAYGGIDAATPTRDVEPYVIKFGLGLRRKAKPAHARGCCSALRRAIPRLLTSSANCLAPSGVVTLLPSPRAREASALSTAIRISSLRRSRSSHNERASFTASSSRRSRPLSIASRTNAF